MRYIFLTLVILLLNSSVYCSNSNSEAKVRRKRFFKDDEPRTNLVVELAQKHNYDAEEHFVTTPDGYILRLDRIKGHPKKGSDPGKVVLIMHGTIGTSYFFVANGPDYSLAFQLANRGYDVWLGNVRGNPYSRNHTILKPDYSAKFWEFSYDEMAAKDLPTFYDHILRTTGEEKLNYIGWAAGARVFMMAAGAKLNNIAKRTALFVFFGSTGSWDFEALGRDKISSKIAGKIWKVAEKLGIREVVGRQPLYSKLSSATCGSPLGVGKLCLKAMGLALDSPPLVTRLKWSPKADVSEHVEAILGGTSIRTISHLSQLVDGELRKFNYGLIGNLKNYFKITPPAYDLGRISCPTAFYWSQNDPFVRQEDVDRILDELPNIVRSHRIKSPTFSHTDFIFSKEAKKLLYNDIIKVMRNVRRMMDRSDSIEVISEEEEEEESSSVEE